MLIKLKEFKKLEIRTMGGKAKGELFNLKFYPKKERPTEFWYKFEDKLRL